MSGTRRPLLKACLNGARRPEDVPGLPVTPGQLATDAALVVAAGAGAVHVHPRNAGCHESLRATDIGAAVEAIHEAIPGVPVGVSTGAWIERDPARRRELLEAWEVLPDFASVNFSEEGAEDLCALLRDRGVGVEAGLWSAEDARRLVASGAGPRCVRVLLEPLDRDPAVALETAREIEVVLDAGGVDVPRLLHGSRTGAWTVLTEAFRRGMDSRIGLEDARHLPDGTDADGNEALVAAAVAIRDGR
ncbi:MAG: hypothetical protein GEU80_09775 [Dehalococcoidia bacterium]|nr:hypothetical protein [Dehalococcoidia bacterium]